jgi:hypothetical protein
MNDSFSGINSNFQNQPPSVPPCQGGSFVILILCALLHLLISPAIAAQPDECTWKATSGEAVAEGIAPEEAKKLASDRAKQKVAEEVAGVTILGSSLSKESVLVSDLVSTLLHGRVTTCRNEKWENNWVASTSGKGKTPHYQVDMECCVAADKGEVDPYFTLTITSSKPVYVDGEEVALEIRSGKDAHLTLFHLGPDNKATMLLPNRFQKVVPLIKGQGYAFPAKGLAMKARNNPGKKKEVEHFVAVATKEWLDIEGIVKIEKGKADADSLFTAIARIPAAERALSITAYEVHQRK